MLIYPICIKIKFKFFYIVVLMQQLCHSTEVSLIPFLEINTCDDTWKLKPQLSCALRSSPGPADLNSKDQVLGTAHLVGAQSECCFLCTHACTCSVGPKCSGKNGKWRYVFHCFAALGRRFILVRASKTSWLYILFFPDETLTCDGVVPILLRRLSLSQLAGIHNSLPWWQIPFIFHLFAVESARCQPSEPVQMEILF